MPNCSSMAFWVCGVTRPCSLPIMVCTGLPGIRWGSRKFTVIATHAVTMYTASFRVMAIMPAVPFRTRSSGGG